MRDTETQAGSLFQSLENIWVSNKTLPPFSHHFEGLIRFERQFQAKDFQNVTLTAHKLWKTLELFDL